MRTLAAEIVETLTGRGETIAVAESLTGGLLVAELITVPGASLVVRGGVVAYATDLKARLLGVDGALLAQVGAVDAEVATQMARGVRLRLGHGDEPTAFGLATTGVAGPDPQDGQAPGTVFIAVATAAGESVRALRLDGDREAIRRRVVSESLLMLIETIAE
ncbi:MAG: competence protein [Leifsonia sp.]|nr:competence protein [Leifsonia sp.]|tara:strand:+ start:37721 stop:38206 length:486 start_codon:yes stop_codon:yes gene_type:complete